jgi:ankyrin repeat protein
VALLLERGASLTRVNEHGTTMLGTAVYNGDEELVRILLAHGVDPSEADGSGKGPMIYAAAKGFAPIVQLLLDAGVDPNKAYGHDLTALMWAAGHPNIVPTEKGLALVEMLVARGADLNRVDDRGRSALMIAAERGHAEIASWLVAHGADPALKDRQGKSAVDLAASPAVVAALNGAAN